MAHMRGRFQKVLLQGQGLQGSVFYGMGHSVVCFSNDHLPPDEIKQRRRRRLIEHEILNRYFSN